MSAFKQLGNVPLPQVGVRDVDQRDDRGTDIARRGRLDSDRASAEGLRNDPADLTLRGELRPPWLPDDEALLAAAELEELAGSDRGPLPFFDQSDERSPERGFYEIEDATVEPRHPDINGLWRFDVRLSKVGTRQTHWQAIDVRPQVIENPFGNIELDTVLLPAQVDSALWFDRTDGALEAAGTTSNNTAAGEVSRVNTPVDSFDDPVIVYRAELSDETTGAAAFDSRGFDSKLNGDNRQWQAIYETGHDFFPEDTVVLSSKAVRLFLSPVPDETIVAEKWNPFTGSWEEQSLRAASNWRLADIDIQSLDRHHINAQLLFEEVDDGITGASFAVVVGLDFGRSTANVRAAPQEEPPFPDQLLGDDSLFEPIASESELILRPTRTLVDREVVRR